MSPVDINKWVSGETELFFDPRQTSPSVSTGSNPGKEGSTARPSSQKFEHIGIFAVVGGFALVGLVCFVLAMRYPVESSLGRRTAQPSGVGATSTSATAAEDASRSTPVAAPLTETPPTLSTPMLNQPPTTLSDARVAAFLKDVSLWYDRRTEAASRRDRRFSTPQEALPQHRLTDELPHKSRAVITFPDVGNRKETRREIGRGDSVD